MRIFEVFLCIVILFILSPLFVIIVVILRLTGEGEVFYLQERIGMNGESFKIIKFATMLKDSPNIGSGSITSKDDDRILPFGKVLRKTKINELLQFVNVLKGEMAIIGPRPHVKRDLLGVDEMKLRKIFTNKPGLSGVASIVFRNEEKLLQQYEDPRQYYDDVIAPYKADLEVWYANYRSIGLDFLLMFLTAWVIVSGNTNLIFKIFSDLPTPPKELSRQLF